MATLSDDTQRWLERATAGTRPYGKVFDSSTLILSVVRDQDSNPSEYVTGSGYLHIRAVDQVRRRRLRLGAKPRWGRVVLDGREPGVQNGELSIVLDLPMPELESLAFVDVDYTCRFEVANTGQEEVNTTTRTERLTSRFFAAHGSPIHIRPPVTAIDILHITAMKDERDAVLNVARASFGATWQSRRDSLGYEYHTTSLIDRTGKPLRIALALASDMGQVDCATAATRMLADFASAGRPRCLTMSGICAGKRGSVFLGDVIVAERLFGFDNGMVTVVKNNATGVTEEQVFEDIRTFNLSPRVRREIEAFHQNWTARVPSTRPKSYDHQKMWLLHTQYLAETSGSPTSLEHPDRLKECPRGQTVVTAAEAAGLLEIVAGKVRLTPVGRTEVERLTVLHPIQWPRDPESPQVHIAPIGTNARIQRDPELFERLRRLLRKILGVEMEGAAVGSVAQEHGIPGIVAKAVVDYADLEKDDNFRIYACEVSAHFILTFLVERGGSAGIFD